jgi:hypothetical protein
MNVICEYCGKEYSSKGLHTHLERVHLGLNSKYSSGNNGKYDTDEFRKNAKLAYEKRVGPIEDHVKVCQKCGKEFIWSGRRTSKQFDRVRYCSNSCAHSRVRTPEMNQQQSENWILKLQAAGKIPIGGYKCSICSVSVGNHFRKFCSEHCRNIYNQQKKQAYLETLPPKTKYRKECKFDFSLRDFPNEFNFKLLTEVGMYQPTNHGDNLAGLSRDHMVSVNYGFEHGIPAEIIRHPANCNLIPQHENAVKHSKCSITIEELYDRIRAWDAKYGDKC